MEVECIKYKEKMKADEAICKHPGDYCKYRTSCIIQFISSENKAKKIPAKKTGKTPREENKNNS